MALELLLLSPVHKVERAVLILELNYVLPCLNTKI